MERPYRCQNPAHPDEHGRSIFDFRAREGKCPKCGASDRDPRSARFIVRLVTIHYDPPGEWGRGQNHQACNPAIPTGREPATGDPLVVTCPACRETEVWQSEAAKAGHLVPREVDYPVEIDPGKGTMTRAG